MFKAACCPYDCHSAPFSESLPASKHLWVVPTSDFSLGPVVWEWVLCHCCSHSCASNRWLIQLLLLKNKTIPCSENLQFLNAAAAQLERSHISAFLQLNWCFKIERWHKDIWKSLAVVLVTGLVLRWEHSMPKISFLTHNQYLLWEGAGGECGGSRASALINKRGERPPHRTEKTKHVTTDRWLWTDTPNPRWWEGWILF